MFSFLVYNKGKAKKILKFDLGQKNHSDFSLLRVYCAISK